MQVQHRPRKLFSLRFRFSVFTLVLTGFSFFLFFLVFIISSSRSLKKSSMESAQVSLNQAALFLQEQMAAFRNSMDIVTLDESCIQVLEWDPDENYGSFDINFQYTVLKETIQKVLFRSRISDIFIVTDNPVFSSRYGKVFPMKDLEGTEWIRHVSDAPSSFVWDTSSALSIQEAGTDQVICTRYIPYTYQPYQAYVCGIVSRSMFEELLNNMTSSVYTSCYTVNSEGTIIFGTNQVPAEDMPALQEWMEKEEAASSLPHAVTQVAGGTHRYFIGYAPIKNTDMKVVYIYAYSEESRQNILSRIRQLGVILLCILPVVLGLAAYISGHITRPLEKLKKAMLVVSEGNFNIPVLPGTKDEETNSLTRYFNYMLTKISNLLDEQYRNGQKLKDLELQSLQAQINPHFLYNTLDLIKWRAVRSRDEKIQEIITALAEFYRTGLSKGKSFIPLKTELIHIQSYVRIQNMRFDDCITFKTDVLPECNSCLVPRLTLQPVVENAIVHGILESQSGCGEVVVSARIEEENLVLTIRDDGRGMDAAQMSRIRNPEEKSGKGGYGLYNVNERIHLYYGEACGLSFDSHPGQGTTVTIVLPRRDAPGSLS